MKSALVVVGAKGALGSCVLKSIDKNYETTFLFDRLPDERRCIRKLDLAVASDIQLSSAVFQNSSFDQFSFLVCAGKYNGGACATLDIAEFNESINVNLLGICNFVFLATSWLLAAGKRARFVVVSSAAARVGSKDVAYGISKAGLEGLVRSLSKSFAEKGITAIGVSPGVFDSPMADMQSVDRVQAAVESTHLKRKSRLEEVASVCKYALLEAPDSLTGTFISPNGGQVCV